MAKHTALAHDRLDPQTIAQLNGLQLRVQSIVEGYLAGQHRGPFQGHSVEYAQHREYVPGDDLRYLDWKAFGKTDKLYLKQFEEETNLVCHLLLDASESMLYRGRSSAFSKFDYGRTLAATLAYLVLHQHDSVGLVTFDREIRQWIEPNNSPGQLDHLLEHLEELQPSGRTDLGPILHDLAARLRRRGLVVIISDLLDDVPRLLTGLKHFRYRRHDLIVFHLLDPDELEFPFQEPTLFRGLESHPSRVVDARRLQRTYRDEVRAYSRRIRAGCRSQGADYVLIRTDQSWRIVLSHFLSTRMRRIQGVQR